jgi:hypothetical protein
VVLGQGARPESMLEVSLKLGNRLIVGLEGRPISRLQGSGRLAAINLGYSAAVPRSRLPPLPEAP